MKRSIKGLLVIVAIVMSFGAVQTVWAGTIDPTDTIIVEGKVVSLHDPTGIVLEDAVVDGVPVIGTVTVGGIGPVWFWENQSAIPEVDEYVIINAYEVILSDDTTTLIACSITIGEVTVTLRNDDGSPAWLKKPSATLTALSVTPGDGICDGCPGCDECEPKDYQYLEPGPHGNNPNSDE